MSVILTILLTVLKIIGIALLVILGLLLLVLLLVLLVPVRYDIRGVKETPTIKEAWAQGSITWLLRLIGLEASYRNGVVTVLLRILTFRIKEIRIPGKDSEPERSGEAEEEPWEEPAGPAETEVNETEEETTVNAEAEKAEPEKTEPEKIAPEKTVSLNEKPAADEPVKKAPDKVKPEKKPPAEKKEKAKNNSKGKEGKGKSNKDLISGIGELIASIPQRIADLIQSVFDHLDQIDDLIYKTEKKIGGMYRKAEPFISEDAKGLYMRTIRRLIQMLKHFLPRKISGYLHFGTGAPDLTGELTGLIYLILPAGSRRFSVEPEFNETVLETDCRITGHIRFIHALVFLVRTAFDRQVWRLIRAIRRKSKKAAAK